MPQSQALRGVELTAVRTAWGFQAFIAGISFLVLLFQSADVVYNTWKYDFNSRPEVIFWMVRRLVATISASLIVYTALVQYASFEHIEFKTCRKLAVRLELVKSASVLCGCLALFVGTLFVNGECGSWNGGEIRRAAAVAIIPFSFVFAVYVTQTAIDQRANC